MFAVLHVDAYTALWRTGNARLFFFCQYETGSVCREIYVVGTSSGRPRGEMNSQMRIIH